jgi:hypothetical protein
MSAGERGLPASLIPACIRIKVYIAESLPDVKENSFT